MNTCDTCKWWMSRDYPHCVCENKKVSDGTPSQIPNEAYLAVHDEGEFVTGPKFGCIHHEPK